ncbi:hypothetical protein [Pseudooceanicola aestuarii]|uniref:hypothetical protein n=1 Tax=Pseudooceanicola aestuarii TaxID=2697319 RepID=UPI0013D0131B|nr:hypothetical protein [Pseudooceanicola aestuarii]
MRRGSAIVFWGVFGLWLACFSASFVMPGLVGPVGDGFTRGLNRVSEFFKYQIGATLLAVILVALSRGYPWRSLRGAAGRLPAGLAGGLVLLVVVLILVARLQ